MEDAEETLVELARMIAGGEAAVARTEAAAERVRRDIEPARREVETDRRGRRFSEEVLAVDGKLACEDVAARPLLRAGDGRDQRNQVFAKLSEELRDLGGRGARLVLIEQSIIRVVAV